RIAASAESGSEHPLGVAMVRSARGRNLPLDSPETFEAIPGLGTRAKVFGHPILLGNRGLMAMAGVGIGGGGAALQRFGADRMTAMGLSVHGQLPGGIAGGELG